MSRTTSFRRSPLTLAAICLFVISAPLYAQTQPVTLAWDGNTETSVAGYIVYVGNVSGSYTERYDVGDRTTFVYTDVTAGRPYFFAVAAYKPGPDIGPLSEEIFFLSGPSTSNGATTAQRAQAGGDVRSSQSAPSSDQTGALCTTSDRTNCYSLDRLVNVVGDVSALTPTGDGRLLFIANGKDVRVIAADTLMPDSALTAEDSTRLSGLVLDPLFDRNRYVYVGEILTRVDGSRELSIVRYREVASVLAEGAAIVTAIPLPAHGDAPFTIDAARRLYVAVPAPVGGFATSPYDGMVLRFESDGSVSRDSRGGSPVFAQGYAEPASLAWSGTQNELWLAGTGADWDAPLARLPLSDESAAWPRAPSGSDDLDADASVVSLFSTRRTSQSSPGVAGVSESLVVVDEDGALLRVDAQTRQIGPLVSVSASELGGEPTSAAADGGDLYIVLAPTTDQVASLSQIVRLRQRK